MTSENTPPNILVVEDEQLLRWAICRKLEDSGVSVFDAPSCLSAVELAVKTRIDLLISDFRLADGFGDDLARKLGGVRLVLMTGETENLEREGLKGIEVLEVMKKPVDLDRLVDIARELDREDRPVDACVAKRIGAFKILTLETEDDLRGLSSNFTENLALRMGAKGDSKLAGLAVKKLSKMRQTDRRVCVIRGPDGFLGRYASDAGIDVVESTEDLEALSRRLVSDAERARILSVAVEENQ